tara:strand:+ start:2710 stop:3240 length:531 start_codon:yes stop_codon:yes gene_type:complete
MKITVPTTLADISVKQWIKLSKTDDVVKRVSILCGVTKKTVKSMTIESMETVNALLEEMEDPSATEFELHPVIELNNIKYGLHPNLSELTVGEFADLETACEDSETNLLQILSILYRPITEQSKDFYKIQPYSGKENKKIFNELKMDKVFSMLAFFLNIGLIFMKDSVQSLEVVER